MTQSEKAYVGRFAPSPSGPLHFGSLFCALVSYLHAKQANGRWLVRIEDVDETRAIAHADQTILNQLRSHGLHWDGDIVYQTQRKAAYKNTLHLLESAAQLYACTCTRKMIRSQGLFYTGHCANSLLALNTSGASIRMKNDQSANYFTDLHLGKVTVNAGFATEDIVVKRKDGLFSYNLAVVVDDIFQSISHVVRGADLVDTTLQQALIYRKLGLRPPQYFHLPVIASRANKKLSKQNHAAAILAEQWYENLCLAAKFLGFPEAKLPNKTTPEAFISYLVEYWQPVLLPKEREILLSQSNNV
ncbi:tRNA glutamyl-Q(34) synthetase GluQRS [Glaciecola sp. MH2013]|uniref:tRNA glutamyl-Q(34) synthetase GluQRS n=1 Tax=Glaciecola sp. MH2013 TaxID=2785524 RepID=UPI0018A11499|nr:tRNA glutamyl-Q(34) synthetase GluQRS [Glaciecola sp. MH2013]MBF7073829.1 tRNA glutamyl-Q(34) synthetase GluQRS [Glaciecola sp. MH2013]